MQEEGEKKINNMALNSHEEPKGLRYIEEFCSSIVLSKQKGEEDWEWFVNRPSIRRARK